MDLPARNHFAVAVEPALFLGGVHFAVFADDATGGEVVGKGEDEVGQFQRLLQGASGRAKGGQLFFDRIVTIDGADDVAGDGAGGIAVAVVVDSGDEGLQGVVNVPRDAVKGNRPRLVARPTLAEGADGFGVGNFLVASEVQGSIGQADHLADRGGEPVIDIYLFHQVDAFVHQVPESMDGFVRGAGGRLENQPGEQRGGQEGQWMFVRDLGDYSALFQDSFGGDPPMVLQVVSRFQQAHRRHPHDTATALAVIRDLLPFQQAFAGAQAGQARGAPMRQLGKVPEPRVVEILTEHIPFLPGLRIIPVHIGATHIIRRISADAAHGAAGDAHQDAIGREERHLGIVADEGLAGVVQVETGDSGGPITVKDGIAGQELDRVAERIPRRARHQAAAAAVLDMDRGH